jgi:hypothetical protein
LANVKKKSSPLKLLGQMEPNLAGSIYVRSSIEWYWSKFQIEIIITLTVSIFMQKVTLSESSSPFCKFSYGALAVCKVPLKSD